jgi:hypothetical protein
VQIRCTQCGAPVTVPPDARLLECPYCSTSLVVDGEGLLFREVLLPTVRAEAVHSHLRRFLSGPATAADLDREARLGEPVLEYFPFWAFALGEGGKERIVLQPAAPSSLQGLQNLEMPAGVTQPWSPELTAGVPVLEPDVPASTARDWLEQRSPGARVSRTTLYHVPLWQVRYEWRGRAYAAAVDGVSGRVFPADFPAKAEAPYVVVAAAAVVLFGLEGLVVGNLLLKAALYLLTAPPLMLLAWLTTRKV